MKTTVTLSLLLGALFTFQTNYSHSQVKEKLKGAIGKSKKSKGVGVEVTDDEQGISGNYYVWYPNDNNWFKKKDEVAIQFEPTTGKLIMHTSKKESIKYYTDGYINKYKLTEKCGEFAFKNNYNAPQLWTMEAGVFLSSSSANTNLNTCEATYNEPNSKTFIMSKDKEFIDNMTEEKFKAYVLENRSKGCNCLQEVKAGQKPLPKRKMRDEEVEKSALKLIQERAAQQGWKEEILGVYVASEDWSGIDLWVSTGGEWEVTESANIVIVMRTEGKCKWQRAAIAKDAWKLAGGKREASYNVDGVSLLGVVPENNPTKCDAAETILK